MQENTMYLVFKVKVRFDPTSPELQDCPDIQELFTESLNYKFESDDVTITDSELVGYQDQCPI